MINFLIWIIAGALLGWVAGIIMHTNNRQGLVADIVVGILGAFVGGYFLSPLFGAGTINEGDFSIPALLVSLGGSVILLAFSRLVRNIAGFRIVILNGLGIHLYFNCWIMSSTADNCASLKALPFLQ